MSPKDSPVSSKGGSSVQLMTYDPAHFHAALVHRKMYEEVSPRVDIYGPLDGELLDHLQHLVRFNTRSEASTGWNLEVHTGADAFERMLQERPGNAVVMAGRNRQKIDHLPKIIEEGLHVLVDKPWITEAEDFPRLERMLDRASSCDIVTHDMMTRRHDATALIQRALVDDSDVLGRLLPRSAEQPAVYLESVHHLAKTVDGEPNRRPTWYFDIREQGEGLADVSVHLVDQSLWTLFPGERIDYRSDVEVLSADRWPTQLTREEFVRVTGESQFPDFLQSWIENGELAYYCNGQLEYTVRDVHVRIDVQWEYGAEDHGDGHAATYRGDRSEVQVLQGPDTQGRPELYVIPRRSSLYETVERAVERRLEELRQRWPGLEVEEQGDRLHVVIPDRHRHSHEAQFTQLAERFVELVEHPEELPDWERAQLLAKYYITTRGVQLSRENES